MWRSLRDELHPKGFELVTVGLDTLGDAGCRAFIEAARPTHPSLLDRHHVLAELFGVINIPSSVWIDEKGMIVRPAEVAPAPPQPTTGPRLAMSPDAPQRFVEIMAEAAKIRRDTEAYHAALRDWVANGADSRFALSPDEVIDRSRPRDADKARGHAHFQLASQLEMDGHHAAAVAALSRGPSPGPRQLDVPPPGVVAREGGQRCAGPLLAGTRSEIARGLALRRRLADRCPKDRRGELQRSVAAVIDNAGYGAV